ncbi:alpha/beta hydrolase [Aggregicoccus sp. 17bor-14]|uniref:alpha/beta fold hydrolase n=1 Tax=Myxococcaceae TaxID=31 RepID=UPI00129CE517|nr:MULTISPECIES: alpha/beta hydrolase [Myxococcaceae]MBF5044781.1 alpha/beta hydrolase [Simulacricoccus sp. 17bor-14]MRI90525.1 alpha/beta hydrolase [Aggregicoccus sp. 17bor-14]
MDLNVDGLAVKVEGRGAPLLLVHGSAADLSTWAVQRSGLEAHARLLLYDRRGAGESPLREGERAPSVQDHARDAARVVEEIATEPVVACGSSFGAVVVLELARTRPELLRGMVLIEPPLAASDTGALLPPGLWESLERTAAESGGPAASEAFLRYVLGEEDVQRLPRLARARVLSRWDSIRRDCLALGDYRPDYASLSRVQTPALLLGGVRSPPQYAPTLAALGRTLPNAHVEQVPGMGHMLHADVRGHFNRRVLAFMESLPAP